MQQMIEHMKVMLVDDDDTVREAVSSLLEGRGWFVESFESAEAGIDALKDKRYDAVLADMNMPGLNGIGFIQKVRETTPGIPVVIITGYPSIDTAVEAMKVGAVDFIAKPFKSEELEIALRRAVDHGKLILGERRGLEHADEKQPPEGVRPFKPEAARHRLESKIKELSILHTISESLDEVSDKEVIFRKTMDLAQIISGSLNAFIMVLEHERQVMTVQAVSGYKSDNVKGMRFFADEEPFKSVLQNRCYSYLLSDDPKLSALSAGDERISRRVPLFLAPMFINKEVVAVLGLVGRENGHELTREAVSLLLNLTAKASLKIENIALTENIYSSIMGALNSLLNALDARDTYTKDHSQRVTHYALRIARALGCPREVMDCISFAGPLHDIGKIAIRDEILLKRGSFTADERELMKSHVIRGEEILKPLNLLSSERDLVLYHHERWDGAGYPKGLKAVEIPLVARIFTVADTFDAMTSTRPYRIALGPEIAKNEILRCKGTQFDPEIVDAFLDSGILRHGAMEAANG